MLIMPGAWGVRNGVTVIGGGGGGGGYDELIFGAIMNTVDRYAWNQGDSNENQLTTLDPGSQGVVSRTGVINRLVYTTAANDATTVFGIWVQGAEVATVTLTANKADSLTIPDIPVTAGNVVALSLNAGTAASFATTKLGVQVP